MERKQIDIYSRIFSFVTLVFATSRNIPNTLETVTIKKQLLRSASSIGANAQEADATDSRKDFIYKMRIAKKESKETFYWINLLKSTSKSCAPEFETLMNECDQILRILSAIIINTKKSD